MRRRHRSTFFTGCLLAVFQPRFCLNSANNDNTVTQPWMYEENLPYIRAAYQLRYRLLPTLYSLMYESNQDGMPAWRPLFLEFPDDPKCYTDKNLTFMFGKSILVANVVEKGATTRTIWVKFAKPAKKDFTVTVSTEKFDLIGMAED